MSKTSPVYYAFAPTKAGTAIIGLEKLSECAKDIHPLYVRHYAEMEPDGAIFEPDYERTQKLEELGQFVLFTVRIKTKMVGYIQYFVFRGIHNQNVYQAKEDAFFLDKESRGQHLAPALLKYTEVALIRLGCKTVTMSSKAPVGGKDMDGFLRSQGYHPVAISYMKDLQEANHGNMQQPTAAA